MAKRGSVVVRVNTAVEGFENMASELAKALARAQMAPRARWGAVLFEPVFLEFDDGKQVASTETEGDRLARFFATSAHEGHEQVRAEPERDEVWPMIDCEPVKAARGEIAGDPRASAAFMDWGDTCIAVEVRRQDERRLAAALARIPDDFDLLPDAE